MNEKIQAILIKTAKELVRLGWTPDPDFEITIKSERQVPLTKKIKVEGQLHDNKWNTVVDTYVNLKLTTPDEITYFPEYTVYANFNIDGAKTGEDIAEKLEADSAFTDKECRDDKKIAYAAKKIDRVVEDLIGGKYQDFIDSNAQDIFNFMQGGYRPRPDDDE